MKKRLDVLLVERGLAESRTQAQALVMAGRVSGFDKAGQQVDEVALSIWSTQAYKRYVRARLTESPQGVVDRLFVPPNMADAISNAVFNGRHGDACGMLKDLWGPFGLDGMPRLIVVLAKHRSDPNHWVVHRCDLFFFLMGYHNSLLFLQVLPS